MTALNTIVTPTAVHVSTDGASYLRDGRIVWAGQKVAILAHLPAVIGVRGPVMHVPSIVANASANFTEFDALAAEAPGMLRSIHDQYKKAMNSLGRSNEVHDLAEFVVAGWSNERERLEAYMIESHDQYGRKPWTPTEIPEIQVSPSDQDLVSKLDFLNLEEVMTNPEGIALRIMELQRERPFKLENGQSVTAVGKFCQLTTLTRSGISTQILRRWE